jgi:hypothetical protein
MPPESNEPSASNDSMYTIAVTVTREVPHRPWWAGLATRYEKLLGVLPSHRDTKKGRANAKQVKVVLLAAGVGIIALLGGYWIVLGCMIAASALILPVSQNARRAWVARSRSARKNLTREAKQPGELRFDGRRVVLHVDGDNLRRVLTHKGKHTISRRSLKGHEIVGILPPSAKKSESIWVMARGRSANASLDRLDRAEVDLLVDADADALDDLIAHIEEG